MSTTLFFESGGSSAETCQMRFSRHRKGFELNVNSEDVKDAQFHEYWERLVLEERAKGVSKFDRLKTSMQHCSPSACRCRKSSHLYKSTRLRYEGTFTHQPTFPDCTGSQQLKLLKPQPQTVRPTSAPFSLADMVDNVEYFAGDPRIERRFGHRSERRLNIVSTQHPQA